MTFKKVIKSSIALCITVILVITVCGCEDLGAYDDTEEYYNSFGDIVLINGTTREINKYSVEKYFYNKESREEFLAGEDGAYKGVEHSDYVYMAIPFESTIVMDTLALFLQSQSDVSVYINVYITDTIPSNWKSIADNETQQEEIEITEVTKETETNEVTEITEITEETVNATETEATEENEATEETSEEETEDTPVIGKIYDDPDPETRIGEIVVHLQKGKWSSFVLDVFNVNSTAQKSIQINDGQYILLQIRNNSGVRVFDEENQIYVDPQTKLELPKAEITMTNLLIRALDIKNGNEMQGEE